MKTNALRGVSLFFVLFASTYVVSICSSPGLGQGGFGQAAPAPPTGSAALPPSAFPTAQPATSGTAAGSVVALAPAHVASAGSAMMASAILSNGTQQIVIYDHAKQTMAVYQIQPTTGDIQLKSVRKMDADFALQEYNLTSPTPSDIRKNVP